METATQTVERDYRIDIRKQQAEAISHAIWSEIKGLIPPNIEREVFTRIFETVHRNGVMLVRDSERQKLGLDPCDLKGWTPSERLTFEQDRIAAMQKLVQFTHIPSDMDKETDA